MKSTLWICAAVVLLASFVVYRAVADDKPADAGVKVVADFENDGDAKLAKAGDDNVTIAVDESHATSGKKSLKVTGEKGNDYAPVDLVGDAIKGWDKSKYKYLAIDFTTDIDTTAGVMFEVRDADSKDYATRSTIEDLGNLKKGKTTIHCELGQFKRNDKSGAMDLTKITSFRVLIETKDAKADLVTYIDNVRLTSDEPK